MARAIRPSVEIHDPNVLTFSHKQLELVGECLSSLVVLKGKGIVKLDGQSDIELFEREWVYIPPQTRHNVTNTGNDTLEYVWVVAPVK
jgi:mannose-6-phosphate isomerase-like protein (cupin superfamily)